MSHEPIHEMAGFCRVLAASGLLGDESIDAVVADFKTQAKSKPGKYGASLTAFTNYLVTQGKLSCWQCAKLLNHQFKGFFLDRYRIVDQLPHGESFSRFVAEEGETGRVVVLCVRIHAEQGETMPGPWMHWVDDFDA